MKLVSTLTNAEKLDRIYKNMRSINCICWDTWVHEFTDRLAEEEYDEKKGMRSCDVLYEPVNRNQTESRSTSSTQIVLTKIRNNPFRDNPISMVKRHKPSSAITAEEKNRRPDRLQQIKSITRRDCLVAPRLNAENVLKSSDCNMENQNGQIDDASETWSRRLEFPKNPLQHMQLYFHREPSLWLAESSPEKYSDLCCSRWTEALTEPKWMGPIGRFASWNH